MVRQYIGARYVPKFYENSLGTSAWEAGVIYEPLTIVTYNGNSYTSKKTVGAEIGDPSSNPDYWVATGVFNQQLADLSTRLATAEGEISDIQTDIATLPVSRKYVLIADSYGVGTTAGGQTIGWCQKFKDYLGLDNDSCLISAEGGSGFIGNAYTFLQQVADAAAAAGDDAPGFTDVIFAGGYNDKAADAATIETAIDAAVAAAKAAFVNARIWVTMCGNSGAVDGSARQQLAYCAEYYRLGAVRHGAIYFDSWRILKMSTFMSTDGIHPTSTGYIELAQEIANLVQGGDARISGPNRTATLTGVNGVVVAQNATSWYMRVFENFVHVFVPTQLNMFDLQNASSKPTATAFYKLGTFTNNLAKGIQGDTGTTLCSVPITGYLQMTNNAYQDFKGLLCINYDSLWIWIRAVSGGTYLDMTNLKTITLDPAVLKFPLDFT